MAHALTVRQKISVAHDPVLEEAYGITAFAIGGTPTDCVKLYLEALADGVKPDAVVSGINNGSNLGTDVLYSGTVGAALEGYLHGISSFAASLDYHSEIPYDEAAKLLMKQIAVYVAESEEPILYNINFPKSWRGRRPQFVLTQLGNRDYKNAFCRYEENGEVYYIMAGEIFDHSNGEATDIYAAEHSYVAVTPLHVDMTDYMALEKRLGIRRDWSRRMQFCED